MSLIHIFNNNIEFTSEIFELAIRASQYKSILNHLNMKKISLSERTRRNTFFHRKLFYSITKFGFLTTDLNRNLSCFITLFFDDRRI